MSVEILIGDCREQLRILPERSVQTCVTSPPYFGLRDYGVDGQMGLESTPDEFVAGMVAVFREVRRVLSDDGTLWLNLGDSYAGGGSGGRDPTKWPKQSRNDHKTEHAKTRTGMPDKNLIGIPWRVAFALQSDGWILRQDIIWHKPNPMPESVLDRCTKSHEYIFLFAKSGRPTIWRARDTGEWSRTPDLSQTIEQQVDGDDISWNGSRFDSGKTAEHQLNRASSQDSRLSVTLVPRWRSHNYYFDNEAIKEPLSEASKSRLAQNISAQVGTTRAYGKTNGNFKAQGNIKTGLRNKRSVWTVTTKPFKGAHFATFPPDLIEPCILAGCPVGGTVIDPFFGAGTTGLVATSLGRNAIGIELNPEYADMARQRIDAPPKVARTKRPAVDPQQPAANDNDLFSNQESANG